MDPAVQPMKPGVALRDLRMPDRASDRDLITKASRNRSSNPLESQHAFMRCSDDVSTPRRVAGHSRRIRAMSRVPGESFLRIDLERGYPQEFVDALTKRPIGSRR